MVFMGDSERAASLISGFDFEIGLHLNFTELFNVKNLCLDLQLHQKKIASYISRNNLTKILFNPLITDSFNKSFKAQQEEFVRLYGREPEFFNGHHHMHLCANVLVMGMIPKGARVRSTFTFNWCERNLFNILYRRMLESYVSRKFISTNSFFTAEPVHDLKRLRQIISLSDREVVEIEVHPEIIEEMNFLLSDQFEKLTGSVKLGRFRDLHR